MINLIATLLNKEFTVFLPSVFIFFKPPNLFSSRNSSDSLT